MPHLLKDACDLDDDGYPRVLQSRFLKKRSISVGSEISACSAMSVGTNISAAISVASTLCYKDSDGFPCIDDCPVPATMIPDPREETQGEDLSAESIVVGGIGKSKRDTLTKRKMDKDKKCTTDKKGKDKDKKDTKDKKGMKHMHTILDSLNDSKPTKTGILEICGRTDGARIYICTLKIAECTAWNKIFAEMQDKVKEGGATKKHLLDIRHAHE